MKITEYFSNLRAAINGRPQAMTLRDAAFAQAFGSPTASGVHVNSNNAMRLITVQNCVRMRASTLQRTPCHIMNRKEKTEADSFYLYEKLLYQPNFWMTAPDFWGMAEAYVSLRGNFVAYKSMYGDQIRELLPIPSGMLGQISQNADYSLDYAVTLPSGETKHLNQNQVLHLRGLTLDGYTGMNPIEYARELIGRGMASSQFLSQFFSKGMHPGVIFEHPEILSAPAFANRKANLKEKYAGLGNAWETMLIDEGMKATFPEIKLVDAQFIEQMKLGEAQICGLYRVPQMLVAAGDKAATFASSEQFMLFYQMLSVDAPIYESAIRRDLFNDAEKKKYAAKFNMRGLLRGAFADQMAGLQTGINAEIYSPNEAREILDMPPYKGGNEYRTRTSTVKETAKPNEKKPPEEEQPDDEEVTE